MTTSGDPNPLSTVHHPMGFPPKVTPRGLAEPLESMADKTICLLDCRFDNSGTFMAQLAGWFQDHLPQVKTHIVQMRESFVGDEDALAEVAAQGDAAIAGVGL
ncbi:MAG: hypothetical protein ACRDVP_11595 [Acidimicrobiales bacterium]